jgi:hypothetical protein
MLAIGVDLQGMAKALPIGGQQPRLHSGALALVRRETKDPDRRVCRGQRVELACAVHPGAVVDQQTGQPV